MPILPAGLRQLGADRDLPDDVLAFVGRHLTAAELGEAIWAELGSGGLPPAVRRSICAWVGGLAEDWPEEFAALPALPGGWPPEVDLTRTGMNVRTRNWLSRNGCSDAAELSRVTVGEVLSIRNLGVLSLLDLMCVGEVLSRGRDRQVCRLAPAAHSQIVVILQRALRRRLDDDVRAALLQRPELVQLAGFPPAELAAAADRVVAGTGWLRLSEWLLELRYPTLGALRLTPESLAAEPELAAMQLRELLATVVDEVGLDSRLHEVLSRRLGLFDQSPQLLGQIAGEFGLSRERIRQLEVKSVARLRRSNNELLAHGRAIVADLLLVDGSWDPSRVELLSAALFGGSSVQPIEPLLRVVGVPADAIDELRRPVGRLRRQRRRAERRQRGPAGSAERRAARLERLLAAADWPEHAGAPPERESLIALRCVTPGGSAGAVHSVKVGRDVEYESGMERDFIELLERCDAVAFYQEQPVVVPYEYRGADRVYFPDLLVVLCDGRTLVVEVKPMHHMALSVNRAKFAAAREYCFERGWGFLVTDGWKTSADLLSRPVDADIEGAVVDAVCTGPIRLLKLRELKERHPTLTAADIARVVMKHSLTYRRAPFLVSQ